MDDSLKAAQRLGVAEYPLAKRCSIYRAVFHRAGERFVDERDRRPAAGKQAVHRLIGIVDR